MKLYSLLIILSLALIVEVGVLFHQQSSPQVNITSGDLAPSRRATAPAPVESPVVAVAEVAPTVEEPAAAPSADTRPRQPVRKPPRATPTPPSDSVRVACDPNDPLCGLALPGER